MNNEVVSFDNELLICVDEKDNVVEYRTKEECHNGEAILHRAFSVFIVNADNELLIQRRSEDKQLWPLFWSNSCCSHPRKGESMEVATRRRIQEELGITADLTFLYKFQYFAPFGNRGSEREVCSVFIGGLSQTPDINENEIAEWKFISPKKMDTELTENPEKYTPWFKMEWERIRNDYWHLVENL